MSGKSKPHFVPPIDLSLLKRLHTPNSWILDRTTENIDWFNKVLSGTPRNYTWESLTAEAFKELGSSLARKLPAHEAMNEIYRLYWHDMLGQIEAFSIMSAWRLGEI